MDARAAAAVWAGLLGEGSRPPLPEELPVRLYTGTQPTAPSALLSAPAEGPPRPGLAGPLLAFLALDAHLRSRDPGLEDLNYRRRFLALPRGTRTEQVLAQAYRLLNIYHGGLVHGLDKAEATAQSLRLHYIHRGIACGITLSWAGADLLQGLVHYYLASLGRPHGERYVECMLLAYYQDIMEQLDKFYDQDGAEVLFRPRFAFNRHCRRVCIDPGYSLGHGRLTLRLGERFSGPGSFPIDFWLSLLDADYIIPLEALEQGSLPLEDLGLWKARAAGQAGLEVGQAAGGSHEQPQ